MAKITYTDKTTANTSPLPTTQKFTSGDANEIKASVNALYDVNPKVYRAQLSQSGTDNPVEDFVSINTIGPIVWTRDSSKFAIATLLGAFPNGKVNIQVTCGTVSGEYLFPVEAVSFDVNTAQFGMYSFSEANVWDGWYAQVQITIDN